MDPQFSDPQFDAKRWLNVQLRDRSKVVVPAPLTASKTPDDPEVTKLNVKEEALKQVYARTVVQSTDVSEAMDAACHQLFAALPK